MKEIYLSQGKIALVDDEDYDYLMQWKWHFKYDKNNIGYARRDKMVAGKKLRFQMHREIMKMGDSKLKVDHINHNGIDNQKHNLRMATHAQNLMNSASIRGKCKYLGVGICKKSGKFTVAVMANGKRVRMGRFINEIDAAIARDKVALEIQGEFACLNFPSLRQ